MFPTFSPIKKYTVSFERVEKLHDSLSPIVSGIHIKMEEDDLLNQIKAIYKSDQQQNVDYLIHCLRTKSALGPALSDILLFLSSEVLSVLKEKPDSMSLFLLRLIQCMDAVMHNEEYSNETLVPLLSCFHS